MNVLRWVPELVNESSAPHTPGKNHRACDSRAACAGQACLDSGCWLEPSAAHALRAAAPAAAPLLLRGRRVCICGSPASSEALGLVLRHAGVEYQLEFRDEFHLGMSSQAAAHMQLFRISSVAPMNKSRREPMQERRPSSPHLKYFHVWQAHRWSRR